MPSPGWNGYEQVCDVEGVSEVSEVKLGVCYGKPANGIVVGSAREKRERKGRGSTCLFVWHVSVKIVYQPVK